MSTQQPNGFDRVQAGVKHPMMRLAHEREIVRFVVPTIVIKMRDRDACRDLEAADHATMDRISSSGYAPRAAVLPTFGLN